MKKILKTTAKFLSKIFYTAASLILVIQNKNLKDSLDEFWEYLETQLEKGNSVRYEAQNRSMIESVLGLHDTIVREIMVPRTELDAVRVSDSVEKVISMIREKGRSRLPVFEDKIDNIVGVIYAKDVLRFTAGATNKEEIALEKLMRPANFIPETKNVVSLLQDMRLKKFHLAIVIDEYGGTAGLVTLEDMIEEIIGEVQDEYDLEEEKVISTGVNTWRVDAKITLEDLDDALDLEIPREDDYDTLAGFILFRLGKIPKHKEKIDFNGWQFTVVDSSDKSINSVKITKLNKDPEKEETEIKKDE